MKRDSIGVFIDGDYFDGVLRSEFNSTRIDFYTFSQNIIPEDSQRFRTYYYKSIPFVSLDSNQDERSRADGVDKFLQSLRHLPRFKVRTGELARNSDGQFRRKGVNVSMAIDITRLTTERIIDKAYLVCSDPDMLPLIRAVRDMGIIVKIFHGDNIPERMLAESDETERMGDDLIQSSLREHTWGDQG